jgi:hypothetical protein
VTARKDAIARPTLALRLANGTEPWQNAKCAGVVVPDPWHRSGYRMVTDLPEGHGGLGPDALYRAMAPALELCAGCPFTGGGGACMKRVQPGAGWHDGVVGGIVFRGGKALRLRKIAQAAA